MIRPYPAIVFEGEEQHERGDRVFPGQAFEVCETACEYRPAGLKRASSTALWRAISSPSWPGNGSAAVLCPGSWSGNCARFLIVVFWPEAS
jgi:hypothetical protein